MLQLLLYDNRLANNDMFNQLSQLPITIQNRINRHKRQKSKLNSLIGYLLLKQTLNSEGVDIGQLKFLPTGKPYIDNATFTFSISHNAHLVGLCWMRKQASIGLDIQEFRTFTPIESAFSFFSQAEQEAISDSPSPSETLIHYWAKKEALVKAGGGRMFDEAAHTNATMDTCWWKGQRYYWKQAPFSFDGSIWVAVNQHCKELFIKKVNNL